MKKAATIKDIAKAIGVSISTVSRALQDKPEISDETKNLVRERKFFKSSCPSENTVCSLAIVT